MADYQQNLNIPIIQYQSGQYNLQRKSHTWLVKSKTAFICRSSTDSGYRVRTTDDPELLPPVVGKVIKLQRLWIVMA
ncbi:hypothetical protein J6590_094016 [Homalodisca vitripennis]|nr:hypothetical protein J6590_094016 [Homalodisca vitripennis]